MSNSILQTDESTSDGRWKSETDQKYRKTNALSWMKPTIYCPSMRYYTFNF